MKNFALSLSLVASALSLTSYINAQAAPHPVAQAVGAPRLPFSPALQVGDSLYISGSIGVDPAQGKPSGTPEQEAQKLMDTIADTLRAANMSTDDLVYVQVFCTDMSLYPTFNKVYIRSVKEPYPARAFLGVKDLVFGAHFEVMAIAQRGAGSHKVSVAPQSR
jgi:2-iminobutanoate/2-iminopropanoate deaminase